MSGPAGGRPALFMNADSLNNAIGHAYVALAAVTLAALALAFTVWAARPLPDGLCSDGSVHVHAHATTYAHP